MNHNKRNNKTRKSQIKYSLAAGRIFFVIIIVILVFLTFYFVHFSLTKGIKGHQITKNEFKRSFHNQNIPANRGNIYDSNGNLLAGNATTYNLYAVLDKKYKKGSKPLYVTNKKKTASVLSKVLKMPRSDVYQRLKTSKKTFQVEFGSHGKNLNTKQHDEIASKRLPGIYFTSNPARFYPNGTFASYLIGLSFLKKSVSKPGLEHLQGIMGIEKSINKYLSGRSGIKSGQKSANNKYVNSFYKRKTINGDNVQLTLNYNLQLQLEKSMSMVNKKANPRSMAAILINAKTGAIEAASQRPTFNNANAHKLKTWDNLLVQDPIEPGSTMKTFALAAAIDSGHWHPNDTFKSGNLKIGNKTINDAEPNMGILSYLQAFIRSSNVGFAKLECNMGPRIWHNYINKFRFLKTTKTKLPNEASGSMVFNDSLEQANTAFGQGIRVTPIHIVQALTAIADKGRLIRPYLVQKIISPKGKTVYKNKVKKSSPIISSKTASRVRTALTDVVNSPQGTGKGFSLKKDGYEIGAKTGTAQIVKNGKYTNNYLSSIHSVEVLVPANKPRFIFYMYLNQPKKLIGGDANNTINSVFNPLILLALKNASSIKSKDKQILVPNFHNKYISQAKKIANKDQINLIFMGSKNGKIRSQSVVPKTKIVPNQKIFVKTSGKIAMPNMQGWTLSDVALFAKLANIKWSYRGAGKVFFQNIKPGKVLKNNHLEVRLK